MIKTQAAFAACSGRTMRCRLSTRWAQPASPPTRSIFSLLPLIALGGGRLSLDRLFKIESDGPVGLIGSASNASRTPDVAARRSSVERSG
jgi:hypothetical protein